MNRFLITTADERTWRFDRSILFLGEWCRRYERRHVWKSLDAIVAEPYGLGMGQKERDLIYVERMFDQLLVELANALNEYHDVRHGVRYWHILIGHWLRYCICILLNRYSTIEQVLSKYGAMETMVLGLANYKLTTNDTMSFIMASNDPTWNHVIYAKALSAIEGSKVVAESDVCLEGDGFGDNEADSSIAKQGISKRIRIAASSILSNFSREEDGFIIDSYLPRIEEFKLQISLWQCPQLWLSPVVSPIKRNSKQRKNLKVDVDGIDGLEIFIRQLLPEMLPRCFLEGYAQLVSESKLLPWPTKPKFIFASNNFMSSEAFKAWLGSKIESGVPYIVGQHGNNYGTMIGSQYWPEYVTCDRFVSWGWTNETSKVLPGFVFKTVGAKRCNYNKNGGLLLIEVCKSHSVYPWDSCYEHLCYQDDQFRFVKMLPGEISQSMVVRLHAGYKLTDWADEQRWKDNCPDVKIETGTASIKALIAKSRLVVHSYDSTGILENLNLNIPIVCFWRGGLDHLMPSAKPYYELLRSARILAESPEHAAEIVATHWENIDEWWGSETVQNARKRFCDKYARKEKEPIRTLKQMLTSHAIP